MLRLTLALALTVAAASSALVAPPPAQAESEAREQLLENVAYWRARGRMDKVVETWRKVLRSDPTYADALADVTLWHARRGETEDARTYLTRLEGAHPADPRIPDLRRALGVGGSYRDHVRAAREHARNGRYDQAIASYRAAFGGKTPEGALGLEYYQTLGGTKGGWEEAREGLERIAAGAPDNARYQLTLARHLTYREASRREGVSLLARLAERGDDSESVRAAWRQALLWLHPSRGDVALFRAYLERHPGDEEVEAQLAAVVRDTTPKPARPADIHRQGVADGFEALDGGDAERAEAVFARALERKAEDAEAMTGLALVHLQREEFAKARELFTKVKELAPERHELWERSLASATFWDLIGQGKAALDAGRHAEAELRFEEAAAVPGAEVVEAWTLIGRAKVERGDHEGAEAVYARILEREPAHVPALKALVDLRLRRGDAAAAIEANTRLAEASPDDAYDAAWLKAEELRRRAKQARDDGRQGHALSLLRIARETAPESEEVMLDLAYTALALEVFDEARGAVRALRERAPESDEAKLADVWVSMAERRYAQALEVLRSVSRARMDDELDQLERQLSVQIRVQEALAAGARGKPMAARTMLDEVEREVADDPELLGLVATALAELGMHERGLALMNSAITQARKATPTLLLQLAGLLHKTGDEEKLLAVLRELNGQPLTADERRGLASLQIAHAVRRADVAREQGEVSRAYHILAASLREHPEDAKLLTAFGRVLVSAGELADAERFFNKVLNRDPDDVEARQGVIEAAARSGDEARARAVADEGLERRPRDPRTHLVAARMAVWLGEDGEAMDHYADALALVESQAGIVTSRRRGEEGPPQVAAAADPLGYESSQNDVTLRTEILREMDEIQARYNTEVSAEASTRYRPGEAGLGQLVAGRLPVSLSVPIGFRTRIGFTATPTYVGAGTLDLDDDELGERFGTTGVDLFGLGAGLGTHAQGESGVGLELSLRYETLRLAFGTSPLGFPKQNLLGRVEWRDAFGDLGLRVRGYRDTVRDSVLSWAGATDVGTGAVWGAVTKNGGRADLSLSLDSTLLYLYGGGAVYLGQRVPQNVGAEGGLGAQWTLYDWDGTRFWTGLAVNALAFERNLRFHSFGHGGYFSPKVFVNVGVPFNLSGGDRHSVRFELDGSVGVNYFVEDGAQWFPSDPARQALREELTDLDDLPVDAGYAGRDSIALGLNVSGRVIIPLSSSLDLGVRAAGYFGDEYQEFQGGLWIGYTFQRRIEASPLRRPYDPTVAIGGE